MTPLPTAVLFDFDGVLVDTERLHYDSFQDILVPDGLGYDWDTYIAEYIGFDDRDGFRHRYAQAGLPCPPSLLASLIQRKGDAFLARVQGPGLVLLPGVAALMTACEQAGVPMALCSGATRADIDGILVSVEVPGTFVARITADDVVVSKPDPESYRRAIAATVAAVPGLDSDPARMIAIEDTPHGIASARGAGVSVLGVATTHRLEALDAADWAVSRLDACTLGDLGRLAAGKGRTIDLDNLVQ